MTQSKKIIELENLLKKSEELSSNLLQLNNDVDENKLSKSTNNNNNKSLKNDIKIINKITKEFKVTHEKISEISSKFTDEEKEEFKRLNLKI